MALQQKYFGNLNLTGIKKAVSEISDKVGEYNGDKQLRVNAAMWDDGNISLDIYNKETKESIKLGNLRISQFDDEGAQKSKEQAPKEDMPF